MAKMALCVFRDAVKHDDPSTWDVFLKDRAIVDDPKQLDPEIKQLLPYIVHIYADIVDGKLEISLLNYLRGKAGDEAQLHDLRSVGAGGHVDTEPVMVSLPQHLTNEALREDREEFGLNLDPIRVRTCINQSLAAKNFLIIEDLEPVHAVHLGIPVFYFMSPAEREGVDRFAEKGIIKDVKVTNILELAKEEGFELERWSRMVVNQLIREYDLVQA